MHSKNNQTKPNLKKHSLNSPTKPIQTTKQVYGGLSPPDERLMANKQPIDYVLLRAEPPDNIYQMTSPTGQSHGLGKH